MVRCASLDNLLDYSALTQPPTTLRKSPNTLNPTLILNHQDQATALSPTSTYHMKLSKHRLCGTTLTGKHPLYLFYPLGPPPAPLPLHVDGFLEADLSVHSLILIIWYDFCQEWLWKSEFKGRTGRFAFRKSSTFPSPSMTNNLRRVFNASKLLSFKARRCLSLEVHAKEDVGESVVAWWLRGVE
ncbi:hypothetical protein K457DRAFT_128146 [Linnemannia elongata AG-77]|uniref:Uncharacterized protein n=1 Tax=Linnemannia elongata AG-77 TaxID=1314771 RepID=A0A197JNS5_9FUNG|nr:hypothetical protein K457DRAFT_128146 [Linnemannia elongata AG-77]